MKVPPAPLRSGRGRSRPSVQPPARGKDATAPRPRPQRPSAATAARASSGAPRRSRSHARRSRRRGQACDTASARLARRSRGGIAVVRGAASSDDSCRLPVELERRSLPPLARVHGLPVRRLLVAQADEEIVDHALHLRHVAVECLGTGLFSEAVFEHFSQIDNDMDQVTKEEAQSVNAVQEWSAENNSREGDADKEDDMEAETPVTDRH